MLHSHNVGAPHTAHCLADGNIMISTMGDANGNAAGDFILFDKNFECVGTWTKGKKAICGYDFWYQPYFNVMVASEWGAPKIFRRGFQSGDVSLEDDTGRRLNVYDWQERKLIDTIHLGDDGVLACWLIMFLMSMNIVLCYRHHTVRDSLYSQP